MERVQSVGAGGVAAGGGALNHLTAAEALTRVIARAAHGGDADDGYAISDHDYQALGDVARWLLKGARDRRQVVAAVGLPTVNVDELHMLAVAQADERYGAKQAAADAMGVDITTFWRWRRRAREIRPPAASQGEC